MTIHKELLILIPTYNERENIEELFQKISPLRDFKNFDILFIDDHSPDGSGAILDQLAMRESGVKVIHRSGKLGIGSAHLEGIRYAYDHHYKILITMDADFSHDPVYIRDFLNLSEEGDVIVGSRYGHENSLPNWNLMRKFLTHLGHFLTKTILRMPYDATGAFRLYRLDSISPEVFKLVQSMGYSFFFESLYILHANGYRVKETPIVLAARTYGHSKMRLRDVFHSVRNLIRMYVWTVQQKEKLLVGGLPARSFVRNVDENRKLKKEWDQYWDHQENATGFVYNLIAKFYRKFIIKRLLHHFIGKYFPKGCRLLHAGCGSGGVDGDIVKEQTILALDISENAAHLYQKINNGHCQVIQGDAMHLPLKDESMQGVYNLGVMEHFDGTAIDKMLSEFNRVLKPGGKAVIMWPPEYGLSVIFLRGVHFILNFARKDKIKLHPDEISRVKSKKQVTGVFNKAKFDVIECYFGPRDFFTYVVIVGQKRASR